MKRILPKTNKSISLNSQQILNDLGKNMSRLTVENCEKIAVTDLDFSHLEALWIEVNKQIIDLTKTRCNYGGNRYWFNCPRCGKRVGALYRKPLSLLFLCRLCQNLTYQLTKYRRSNHELTIKTINKLKH